MESKNVLQMAEEYSQNAVKKHGKPPPVAKQSKPVEVQKDLNKEEKIIHRKLVNQLENYGREELFTKYLVDRGFKLTMDDLKDQDIPGLEELLKDVDDALNRMDGIGIFHKDVFLKVLGDLERKSIGTQFECVGLAASLPNNKKFNNTFAHLKCKYGDLATFGPEIRMIHVLAMQALAVNHFTKVSQGKTQHANPSASRPTPDPNQTKPAPSSEVPKAQSEGTVEK